MRKSCNNPKCHGSMQSCHLTQGKCCQQSGIGNPVQGMSIDLFLFISSLQASPRRRVSAKRSDKSCATMGKVRPEFGQITGDTGRPDPEADRLCRPTAQCALTCLLGAFNLWDPAMRSPGLILPKRCGLGIALMLPSLLSGPGTYFYCNYFVTKAWRLLGWRFWAESSKLLVGLPADNVYHMLSTPLLLSRVVFLFPDITPCRSCWQSHPPTRLCPCIRPSGIPYSRWRPAIIYNSNDFDTPTSPIDYVFTRLPFLLGQTSLQPRRRHRSTALAVHEGQDADPPVVIN